MKAYCKHFKVLVSITLLFFSFQSIAQNPEDDCAAAFGNVFMVDCFSSSPLGAVGSNSGNPDPEASCLGGTDVTWYAFEFDAAIVSFGFVDVDTDVALYTGPDCSSLTEIVCQGSMLVPNVPGEIFLVAAVDGQEWEINIPQVPNNEDCTSAEPFSGTLTSQSNVCASVPTGGCSGDNSVWYEVDVATDGSQLDVTITPSGALPIVSPAVSIYDEFGNQVDVANSCSDVAMAVCLVAGTYSIEVASAAGDAGEFDIAETITTPPAEDNCDGAINLGSAALVCGDSENGSGVSMTCPDADADASGCIAGLNGTWYTFTTDASLSDFTIVSSDNFELFEGSCGSLSSLGDCSIEGIPQAADPTVTYFILIDDVGSFTVETPLPPVNTVCTDAEGLGADMTNNLNNCCLSNPETWFRLDPEFDGIEVTFTQGSLGSSLNVTIFQGCGGATVAQETGDFSLELPTCGSDSYFVRVTTDAADCGDFTLEYTFSSCGTGVPQEDVCSASVPITSLSLNNEVCLSGCAQFSCSGDCGASNGLWYAVDFTVAGSGLTITVDPANPNFDPIISVFEDDCSNAIVACEMASTVDVSITSNLTYFIQINANGTPGDFDVCFELTDVPADCSSWSEATVTRPENPDKNQDGPFCPGETVNFCFVVDFIVANPPPPTGNGCQWLQGIIPTVGDGWDLDVTPLSGQQTGTFNDWHEDVLYSPNPPPTTNPVLSLVPNASDPNGLGLEFGGGGLSSGDLLPGGWYSTTQTTNPPCTGTSHPNGSWGENAGGCNANPSYQVCFDLTVKQFDTVQECEEADLSIELFAMADGMTGCWTSTACANDIPAQYFDGEVACEAFTELMADDTQICSGDPADVFIETEDGSSGDIHVILIDEGNTSGAETHEPLAFGASSTTLLDEIENTSGSIQVVIYEAFVSGENCDGPPIQFEVTVFPEIEIEDGDSIEICPGDEVEFVPIVTGGDGGPYDYDWRDANGANVGSGPSIILPFSNNLPPGPHFVELTVTDGNDCTQKEFVDFELVPDLEESISGPLDICLSNAATGTQYCAVHQSFPNSEPLDYLWTFSAGVVLTGDDNEQCININEALTPPGTYNLTLAITDNFDCVHDTTVVFTLSNGPSLQIETDGCIGDQIQILGINTNHMNVPSLLHITQASGPMGTLLPGDTLGTGAPLLTDTLRILTNNFSDTIRLFGASASGCTPPVVEFVIPPVETPTFMEPDASVCEGTSVTLALTNPATFTNNAWTDGSNFFTGASITETPLTTTTYSWSGTNALGCEVTEQFTVVVDPLPTASITGSTTFCAGESTDLTATSTSGSAPFTYAWSNGMTDETISVDSGPSFSVTITDANMCTSVAMVDVSVAANLTPNVSFNAFCVNDPAGTTLDGGAFETYQWFDANGPIAGATDQTFTTSIPGSYFVEVTQGSCSGSSDPVDVAGEEPLPTPTDFGTISVCNAPGGDDPVMENLALLIPPTVDGFWRDENNIPVNPADMVSFDNAIPGTVIYTYVTTNAVAPCLNDTIPLEIIISDCDCPAQVSQLPDQCGDGSANINLSSLTASAGTWTSSSSDITITNGVLVLDDSTPIGTYSLEFTHDMALPSNCTLDYGTSFTVFQPLTAELNQMVTPCNSTSTGDPTSVTLSDLIISGDTSGSWETTNQTITIVNDMIEFENLPTDGYDLIYRLEELNSPCGPSLLPVTINVIDCSCPTIVLNPLPDLCTTDAAINLNDPIFLNNPDGLAGQWTMSPDVPGALLADQFDVMEVPEGTYTFTFTLQLSLIHI